MDKMGFLSFFFFFFFLKMGVRDRTLVSKKKWGPSPGPSIFWRGLWVSCLPGTTNLYYNGGNARTHLMALL